ncbi:hypothetical protein D9M69_694590 [compost metagenome]
MREEMLDIRALGGRRDIVLLEVQQLAAAVDLDQRSAVAADQLLHALQQRRPGRLGIAQVRDRIECAVQCEIPVHVIPSPGGRCFPRA